MMTLGHDLVPARQALTEHSLKIAVLNPYSGPVAEVESCQWLSGAAKSLGHEAILCHDERDVQDCAPDFVLNLSFQNPKLTRFPTYGLLNLPTSILTSAPRFIRNCLTYDAVFVLSPGVADWYSDFCIGVRKPAHVFPLAVTTHEVTLEGDIDFSGASIAYAGTNWDGMRLKEVFELLAPTGGTFFYGPPEKWQHVDQRAVKGLVPFDGESLLRVYRKHGIGLALAHPQFVAEQIPHNRIFEVAASGALVISADYALVREWFGDSFLYVDQTRDPRQVADDILAHLHWVRRNPESAAAKAHAAHEIFRRKFSMSKLLAGALDYHKNNVLLTKRYVSVVSERQSDPHISVVVRADETSCETTGRALDSLAAQTCSRITALLVTGKRPEGFEALVDRYRNILDLRVVDCPNGKRNQMLWSSFRQVNAGYFAIMESRDEYYPNHFALLLDRIDYFRRVKSRAIKGVFSASVKRSKHKTLYEQPRWRDSPVFAGPHYMCIQNFGEMDCQELKEILAGEQAAPRSWLASTDLLDEEVMNDPELDGGDDAFLLLSLLEKERFEFNYEVTACVHVDHDGDASASDRLTPDQRSKIQRRMWGRTFANPVAFQALFAAQTGEGAVSVPPSPAASFSGGEQVERPRPRSMARQLAGLWGAVRYGLPRDFDRAEYLRRNPDVAQANVDPGKHFLQFGRHEGRRWR